ncbi:MAG: dTMP kinase [Chlamydiae bacterium]|nr:dTMP kinase [Chlamydiota bacterium]
MKGLLLSFEGIDGSGKTTLIEGIYSRLSQERKSVLRTRAPGGTGLGRKIRQLLLHEELAMVDRAELFLFLADRAQHVRECILPALNLGQLVLCDRFNDSTVAYQGVARGLDATFVRSLCSFATEGLEPHLTFYLDINPRESLQRVTRVSGRDRIESEEETFHDKIRRSFCAMAEHEPRRIKKLDAMLSPEELVEQAMREIYGLLTPCE